MTGSGASERQIGSTSAADLKSLPCKWQIRIGDFRSRSGTSIISLLVELSI